MVTFYRDPFPGIVQCFKTFETRLCAAPKPIPKPSLVPSWLFWVFVGKSRFF